MGGGMEVQVSSLDDMPLLTEPPSIDCDSPSTISG